jgi:hypothetical protein
MATHTPFRSTLPPTTDGPATIWRQAEQRRGELITDLYTADHPELRSHLLQQLSDQALLQATVHDAAVSDRPSARPSDRAGSRRQALLREAALLDLLADTESVRVHGRERVRRTGDETGDLIEDAAGHLLDALSVENDDQRRRELMDDLEATLTPRLGFQATQILTLVAPLNDSEAHGPDDETDPDEDEEGDDDLVARISTEPAIYWPTEACADLVSGGDLTLYAPDSATYQPLPVGLVTEPGDTDVSWQTPTTDLPLSWSPPAPARRWLTSRRYQRRRHATIAAISASIAGALVTSMAAVSPQTLHPLLRPLHPHLTPAVLVQAVLVVVAFTVVSMLVTAVTSRLTFQAPTWNPLTWAVGRRWYRPGQLVTYKDELAVTSDWMRQSEHGERTWVFVLFVGEPAPYEPLVSEGWWLPLDDLVPVDY